jgi:hypothetical protein
VSVNKISPYGRNDILKTKVSEQSETPNGKQGQMMNDQNGKETSLMRINPAASSGAFWHGPVKLIRTSE